MFLMSWRKWLGKPAHYSGQRRKASVRLRARPRLEALEDRTLPSTFTVLNTLDSGTGSLRQAILDANATPGADVIQFNIAGGGVQTIAPSSSLPIISDPVTIDATTEPGYAGSPLIELNGAGASSGANGLQITAGSSTVRGLTIDVFSGSGIVLGDGTDLNVGGVASGGGNIIEGNIILNNAAVGIDLDWSANNRIGGTTPQARNVISGNLYGIYIVGAAATDNWVQGNYLGTDATGNAPLPNVFFGVNISDASYNHVDGNVLSGNGDPTSAYDAGPAGVTIGQFFGTAQYNTVTNNKIGVGADGTTPVPNVQGVALGGGAQYNTVDGNLIAHNIWQGVQISMDFLPQATPTSDNVISNNQITNNGGNGVEIAGGPGLTFDVSANSLGTAPDNGSQRNHIQSNNISGNGGNGVVIDGIRADGNFVNGNTIANNAGYGVGISGGAQGNQIGGTGSGQANSIHGNSGDGVMVRDMGYDFNFFPGQDFYTANSPHSPTGNNIVHAINNSIRGNSIYHNGGLGIDLNLSNDPLSPTFTGDGVMANDAAGHVGPNSFQNFPVLSEAVSLSGLTAVTGTLNTTPSGGDYIIDFYTGTTAGSVGQSYLGSTTVTADSGGHARFTVSLPAVPVGQFVTATATDSAGNTSEFSTSTPTIIASASLSGTVFVDFNNDGQIDFGEKGIAGVTVALTGTDELGQAVSLSQLTDADGAYVFLNLRPGTYQVTETQPATYLQGIDSVGTAGGSLVATDQFSVQLAAGVDGLNYNFGEQPPSDGSVHKGETATIGFWNNKNGQALIRALNGGTGTELADWLATTLPNTFGVHAGSNNLTGRSNAYVATLFQQDFLVKGVKLDAQVLATALAVYATDATLDSTQVAAQYGFTVSAYGVGTATINVGSNGDAFGVANNSTMTVLDLLLATDEQAVNGLLYTGNTAKRNMANTIYSAVNQTGDIL